MRKTVGLRTLLAKFYVILQNGTFGTLTQSGRGCCFPGMVLNFDGGNFGTSVSLLQNLLMSDLGLISPPFFFVVGNTTVFEKSVA